MVWEGAGEKVTGKVKNLKVGEVEKRRRDVTGERVVVKINGAEEETVRKRGRY